MEGGACDTSATAPSDTSMTENACNGTVNAAFEDTEGLKSNDMKDGSQSENKTHHENNHSTNGDLKSPTKDGLPPAEAVNLELVTMSPYTNSIPVKKESTELDMTDPYDEYFVPVNQHKKYIRGEKLYVTQDKRENMGGSKKKCCCGIVAVLVLGAAVAILVAVLLTQEGGGLTDSEGRNYDKAGFGGNMIPTQPPRSSSSTPATTQMPQIYLDNVLEGELTIDNMEFTPGLSNSSSPEFTNVASSLEEEIKRALFDHQKLHYGASEISVKVIEFRSGSVIVTYRVGWKFKEGIHDPTDPINMEMLKSKLQKHLKDNDGFLYNYRVPVHSIKSNRVIDNCQISNNGCQKGCMYNTTTLQITCTCPFGFKLLEDGKTCTETDYMDTHAFDYPSSSHPPMEPTPEPEDDWPYHHEHVPHVEHDHMNHDHHQPESNEDDHMYHEHLPDMTQDPEHDQHDKHHDHAYTPNMDHEHEHTSNIDHDHTHHPNISHESEDKPDMYHENMPEHTYHGHEHEHSFEYAIDDTFRPTYQPPVEHSPGQSSGDHQYQVYETDQEQYDHSMETHKTIDEESIHPSHPPEMPVEKEHSHEHHLGYLPTVLPPEDHEVTSEKHSYDNENHPNDNENRPNDNENHMSPEPSSTAMPEVSSEVPKNEFTDILLPPHVQEEFLPEYSTFPDDSRSSQVTENIAKSTSTESVPEDKVSKAEDLEVNMESKDASSDTVVNNATIPMEADKVDKANENTTSHTDQEFNVLTPNISDGVSLLETNHQNNKTMEDESREELIDHMPEKEMNKTDTEVPHIETPVVEENTNSSEKSPKYSEVINDLHVIEGNPFETERLNELKNETVAKPDDHLYSDTEKPFDHNVIETFREAKANGFNSTSEDNSTHMGMMDNGSQINEMDKEHETAEVTSQSVDTGSAIFVTPPPEMRNDTSVQMPEDDSPPAPPAEKTEVESSSTPASNDQDGVSLVKVDNKDIELPKIDEESVKEVMKTKEMEDSMNHEAKDENLNKHEAVNEDDKVPTKENDNPEPMVFVTNPPPDQKLDSETSTPKPDDAPMIFVTKMPDLMGPYPVEKEQVPEKTSDKPDVYKLLDDESNNLNSLEEDDYEKENLKSKYQKNDKNKFNQKKFNVKEIYPHRNASDIDDSHPLSPEVSSTTVKSEEMKSTPEIDSVKHILSDDGITTLSPLFTSTPESSSPTSSTTANTDQTTKADVQLDQGLKSDEAFTTLSPLFHSSSSQPTTEMKSDIETTISPLIFDLIKNEKIDAKTEVEMTTNEPKKEVTEMPEMMTTIVPGVVDLMSETTPASINPDTVTPESEPKSDESPAKIMESTEIPEVKPEDIPSVTTMSPANETEVQNVTEMIKPVSEQPEESEMINMSSTEGHQGAISDPVVHLLMNSSFPNSTLYSKCASGQWACKDDSGCIAPNSRCDSDQDCKDGSDEEMCREQGCPGNFQCASGECLRRSLVCDSTPNCSDGSDELNCDEWKCNFDEMQCLPSSRKCIPSLWKCDNVAHCPNNEDEFGCKDSCSNDEFFCPEGWCIPLSKKCDGKPNCAKGEDENNCPA